MALTSADEVIGKRRPMEGGALGGTPLPCPRAIDEAHRRPECLVDVRACLDHGDAGGVLAAVEGLLGLDVLLRGGALRDELEAAVRRRIAYGLLGTGLVGLGPAPSTRDARRRAVRAHPRLHSRQSVTAGRRA